MELHEIIGALGWKGYKERDTSVHCEDNSDYCEYIWHAGFLLVADDYAISTCSSAYLQKGGISTLREIHFVHLTC